MEIPFTAMPTLTHSSTLFPLEPFLQFRLDRRRRKCFFPLEQIHRGGKLLPWHSPYFRQIQRNATPSSHFGPKQSKSLSCTNEFIACIQIFVPLGGTESVLVGKLCLEMPTLANRGESWVGGGKSRRSRRRELAINIPGFGVMLANKLRKLERIKFHDFSCCTGGGRRKKRGLWAVFVRRSSSTHH